MTRVGWRTAAGADDIGFEATRPQASAPPWSPHYLGEIDVLTTNDRLV